MISRSPISGKYDTTVNRESAYEILNRRAAQSTTTDAPRSESTTANPNAKPTTESGSKISEILWGTKRRQGVVEAMAKQAARTAGSQMGRKFFRGLLGVFLGGFRGK